MKTIILSFILGCVATLTILFICYESIINSLEYTGAFTDDITLHEVKYETAEKCINRFSDKKWTGRIFLSKTDYVSFNRTGLENWLTDKSNIDWDNLRINFSMYTDSIIDSDEKYKKYKNRITLFLVRYKGDNVAVYNKTIKTATGTSNRGAKADAFNFGNIHP